FACGENVIDGVGHFAVHARPPARQTLREITVPARHDRLKQLLHALIAVGFRGVIGGGSIYRRGSAISGSLHGARFLSFGRNNRWSVSGISQTAVIVLKISGFLYREFPES